MFSEIANLQTARPQTIITAITLELP